MTSNGLSWDSNIPIDKIDKNSNKEFINHIDNEY